MIGRVLGLLLAVTLTMSRILAATEDGRIGIALIKQFAWSAPGDLTDVLVYRSFDDHTGYLSFWGLDRKETQVPRAQIARLVTVSQPADFPEVLSERDLAPISASLMELRKLCAQFPATLQRVLTPAIAALQTEIDRFKSGQRKVAGIWMGEADYKKRQLDALAEQTQRDLNAKADALLRSFQASRDNLKASYDLIAQLEKLNSGRPDIAQLIKDWKTTQAAASRLKTEAGQFLKSLLQSRTAPLFKDIRTLNDVEALPKETYEQSAKLKADIDKLAAQSRFPQFSLQLQIERTSLHLLGQINAIHEKVRADNLLGAAETANASLEAVAGSSADEYSQILPTIKRYKACIDSTVEAAQAHTKRAEQLRAIGRNSEAIKEYQKAYELVKDPQISERIQSLREQSLGL